MTPEESLNWHPGHPEPVGSLDILPFYESMIPFIGTNGVFVEVGCFLGRSLSFMGTYRPDLRLIAVDPWDTQEDTGECVETGNRARWPRGKMFDTFQSYMKKYAPNVLDKTNILRGHSQIELGKMPRGSVDFIFIDGDHSQAAVVQDCIEAKRIVKTGGIIAGHDWCIPNCIPDAVTSVLGMVKLFPWPESHDGWIPGHSSCWWIEQK